MWRRDVNLHAWTKFWSLAVDIPETYFGVYGVPRSPSPTYSLPPAADAMARALALQKSPPEDVARPPLDRRARVYIDSEAFESWLNE
jgi:hypothetical protein